MDYKRHMKYVHLGVAAAAVMMMGMQEARATIDEVWHGNDVYIYADEPVGISYNLRGADGAVGADGTAGSMNGGDGSSGLDGGSVHVSAPEVTLGNCDLRGGNGGAGGMGYGDYFERTAAGGRGGNGARGGCGGSIVIDADAVHLAGTVYLDGGHGGVGGGGGTVVQDPPAYGGVGGRGGDGGPGGCAGHLAIYCAYTKDGQLDPSSSSSGGNGAGGGCGGFVWSGAGYYDDRGIGTPGDGGDGGAGGYESYSEIPVHLRGTDGPGGPGGMAYDWLGREIQGNPGEDGAIEALCTNVMGTPPCMWLCHPNESCFDLCCVTGPRPPGHDMQDPILMHCGSVATYTHATYPDQPIWAVWFKVNTVPGHEVVIKHKALDEVGMNSHELYVFGGGSVGPSDSSNEMEIRFIAEVPSYYICDESLRNDTHCELSIACNGFPGAACSVPQPAECGSYFHAGNPIPGHNHEDRISIMTLETIEAHWIKMTLPAWTVVSVDMVDWYENQVGIQFYESCSQPSYVTPVIGDMAVTGDYYNATGIGKDVWILVNHYPTPEQPDIVMQCFSLPQADAGWDHSVVLKPDGTVMACGRNNSGQLGNGTISSGNNFNTLAVVNGLSTPTVVQIEAQGRHSMALMANGTVRTWGYNSHGQLGNGSTGNGGNGADQPTPQIVTKNGVPFSDVVFIGASSYTSYAIQTTGTVWFWGRDYYGASVVSPQQLLLSNGAPLGRITQVAGGNYHALALKTDGSVWAWGSNNGGQLGTGLGSSPYPAVVLKSASDPTAFDGVTKVCAGSYHSAALKADGTVWTWGTNNYGQLGNGTQNNSNYPTQVLTASGQPFTGAIAIGIGAYHTWAVCGDGTVWAWGRNDRGQLGNGTTAMKTSPAVMLSAQGGAFPGVPVCNANTDSWNSIVGMSGRTVFQSGYGYWGNIGNGQNIDKVYPAMMLGLP